MREIFDNNYTFENDKEKEHFYKLNHLEQEKFIQNKFEKMKDLEDREKLNKLANNKNLKKKIKDEKSINIEDIDFIIKRQNLINAIYRPNFNILKNTFVKVNINNTYKIRKIKNFVELPNYEICKGKVTNIGFNIEKNDSQIIQGLKIYFISDKNIEEDEFLEFLDFYEIKHENLERFKKKYKEVLNEFSRNLSDLEITRMIEKKNKFNPKKISNTFKKMELIRKRDEAIYKRKRDEAYKFQDELEKIEDEEFVQRKKKILKNASDEEIKKALEKRKKASRPSKNKNFVTIEDLREEHKKILEDEIEAKNDKFNFNK